MVGWELEKEDEEEEGKEEEEEERRGIIPRALKDIFQHIKVRNTYTVLVYIIIYMHVCTYICIPVPFLVHRF